MATGGKGPLRQGTNPKGNAIAHGGERVLGVDAKCSARVLGSFEHEAHVDPAVGSRAELLDDGVDSICGEADDEKFRLGAADDVDEDLARSADGHRKAGR